MRTKERSNEKIQKLLDVLGVIPILLVVHFVPLCSHRTMGGFHFGHRYINDVLPYLYWGILIFAGTPGRKKVVQTDMETISVDAENEINIPSEEEETEISETFSVKEEVETEQMVDFAIESDTETTQTNNLVIETDNEETLIEDPEQTDYTYTLHFALCFLGLALNIVGTIATNMGWV